MNKTILKIDGMACGMCEAHIKDVIRKTFPKAKKVTASHRSGEASFISEEAVDEDLLKKAIDATGYRVISVSAENAKKKGLFGR